MVSQAPVRAMSVTLRRPRRWLRVASAPLVTAFVTAGVLVGPAAVSTSTGCTTHNCDSDCVWVGAPAPDGSGCSAGTAPDARLYQASDVELVWESSPVTGTWIHFPGLRTYTLIWPTEMLQVLQAGGILQTLNVWISTAADNSAMSDATSTPASGLTAEVSGVSDFGFALTNGSCAEYYVRVEVHVVQPGGATPPADAGATADAGD